MNVVIKKSPISLAPRTMVAMHKRCCKYLRKFVNFIVCCKFIAFCYYDPFEQLFVRFDSVQQKNKNNMNDTKKVNMVQMNYIATKKYKNDLNWDIIKTVQKDVHQKIDTEFDNDRNVFLVNIIKSDQLTISQNHNRIICQKLRKLLTEGRVGEKKSNI